MIVEENGAEVKLELDERLAQREERDWTYFGRLRNVREKKLRDPQDVLERGRPPAAGAEEAHPRSTRIKSRRIRPSVQGCR